MDRRLFNTLLSAGLATSQQASSASSKAGSIKPDSIQLARNGWMPNNEQLPVLLYRGAVEPNRADPAAVLEETFQRNGWPAQWRDGVYDFHHYHSTAHEVLGCAAGRAKLVLGGENGRSLEVQAGDILVLPTGTGHCKLEASPDFLIVGAYPSGQHWDICRAAPDAGAVARMRRLAFPDSDPVSGAKGPLTTLWKKE